jgi:hypothetical protein
MKRNEIKVYVVKLLNKFRLIKKNYLKNIDKFDFIDTGHYELIEKLISKDLISPI